MRIFGDLTFSLSVAGVAAMIFMNDPVHGWTAASCMRMSATTTTATSSSSSASSSSSSTTLSRSGHDQEAWARGYTTCPKEIPPTVLDCPDLPKDFPQGTYYRNGHGRFESDNGDVLVHHMFDGDGLVSAMTLDPKRQQVLFRNRFVRTEGYRMDKETGKMSQPGIFGTRVSGGFLANLFRTDFKNVANTHVLYHRNQCLYALWEGGWPYRLDPLTLENDVEQEPKGHDMNGLLQKDEKFAAHYRFDAHSGHVVNFGSSLDPAKGESKLRLYEFDPDMNPIRKDDEVSFVFDGAAVVHDYVLTKNWHVFCMPPASINNQKALMALLGQAAFAEVVDFDKSATESTVYLVPRISQLKEGTAANMRAGEDERIKVIKVPYHFNFHFANAFEDEEGNVVFDSVMTKKAELGSGFDKDIPLWDQVDWDEFVPNEYVRISVSPQLCTMTPGTSFEVISSRSNEFPSIPMALSGKKHRYAYTVGSHQPYNTTTNGRGGAPGGAILKLDTKHPNQSESFSFEPHEFPGEVVFCPKQGADVTQPKQEDKGFVTYVVNGRDLTTDFVILNVEGKGSLEQGPIVRFPLPTFVPHALHGCFVEGLTFPFDTFET